MKSIFITTVILFLYMSVRAQSVAINTDGSLAHASAILDIKSSNKGLLIPRINLVSDSDITTISNPRLSLLVYNTNNGVDDGEGFYFWNGGKWSKLATRTNLSNLTWSLNQNN